MSADSNFNSNKPSVLSTVDFIKSIQIGIVVSIDDPESLGRIKVKIPGQAAKGGDDGVATNDIPWSYPMVPKFFSSTPIVGEGVFVLIYDKQKTHSDRLYFGPIISQLNNLEFDSVDLTGLNSFTFATNTPNVDFNRIPALKGVFPNATDIAVQGRYNTDLIFKKNEVLIRAGKFETSKPNDNNPFSFQFNAITQGYIQIKNDVAITKPQEDKTQERGTAINVVGNKINLLTHKDGSPRFNLTNQDNLISDEELLNILDTAHPLPFGDLLIEYLKLLKNAVINHVHSSNGTPATDLISGGATQDVLKFKSLAEDLENRMLSRNIRIN